MKVYIQAKKGLPTDQDHFNAYIGFKEMGTEIVFFESYDELSKSNIEDVVVGYIGTVKARLNDFGKKIDDMDYPDVLNKYLGRKIWKSTVNTINSNPDLWPVFIKPISNKKFKGRVIRSTKDLIGCGSCYEDYPIFCSEVREFVAEFRVFVLYGEIIDVRRYGGEWDIHCSKEVVESCVQDFVDSPNAYALDFGVTKDGATNLIEVNNTCSIGSYGLDPVLYAKFISARWAELTETVDECKF
ncbi:MAG: ATP-grasp domain-containing protein [Acutalibacteraceae bacterium]|nr:ATP-grasp domain-containing protein [Acutalibacteraceae bacterium]